MRHYFIGVDVAGEANTWVAGLLPADDGLQIAFGPRPTAPEDLTALIDREEPTGVAIDGQLSLAFSEANGFRSCDMDLRALLPADCRTWVASANSLMSVPIRARLLADVISPAIGTILETHPRASLYLELGEEFLQEIKEYKRSADAVRRLTSEWCERHGIHADAHADSDGALDALVCATVADHFHSDPRRLRHLRHTAVDRQGRGPFVVMDAGQGTAVATSVPRQPTKDSESASEPIAPTGPAEAVSPAAATRSHNIVSCPACGKKDFTHWPWGWDAHAAYSCTGLTSTGPEDRKAEFRRRFAEYF